MKIPHGSPALYVATVVFLFLAAPSGKSAVLVTWDITNSAPSPSSGSTNGIPTPYTGIGVASQFVLTGSVSGATSSSGWRWYDGSNFGSATNLDSAFALSNYFTWSVTAAAGYNIAIEGLGPTFFSRGSNAPNSLGLIYSSNPSFTNYRTVSTVTNFPASSTDLSAALAGDLATNSIAISNGATGYFRLVYWGAATNTSGAIWAGTNTSGNDFSFTGAATQVITFKNLTWGGVNGTWNTNPANLAWKDINNTAVAFSANDSATINAASTITVDSNGVTAGSLVVNLVSGTASLLGGAITSPTLTKSGNGILTLAMSNAFSTSTTATGGTVNIAANGALGTGSLALDGASLAVSDPAVTSVGNATSVGTNDASISVASGALGMSGIISASGTIPGGAKGDPNSFNVLNKLGAGTLTLSNSVGTQMTYDNTLKQITASGAIQLNIAAGGAVAFNGSSKTNNLGSGTNIDTIDTVYNGMVWDGDFYLQAGTVQINGGNIRGTGKIYVTNTGGTFAQRLNFNSPDIDNNVDVATNSTLTLSAASGASIKFNGQLTGSGTVANTGSGGASLSNTNPSTFSGTFSVAQTSASSSSRMSVKAQTLASAAAVVFQTNQTGLPKMTIENSSAASGAVIACPISGPGELTKALDGDILLTGSNNFSGGLVIQDAGTVYVTNANSLGTGPLVADSTSSRIGLHTSATVDVLTITNTVSTSTTNSSGAVNTNTMAFAPGTNSSGALRSIQLDSLVTNAGLLKVSGSGNLFVNNTNNTYAGGTEVGTGTIVVSDPRVLSTGPVNFGTTGSSYLRFAAGMTFTNPITVSGVSTNSTNVTKYTANFTVDAGLTATLNGGIKSKGLVGTDQKYGARAEKWGAGTLILSASNDLAESLTINQGTLGLAVSNAVSAVTGVRCAGGTLLLSYTGEMSAGDLSVEANTVLNMGSSAARSIRFASLATTFSSIKPFYLTVTNTANGSIYFPTNTSASRLQQIKSAEQPTYVASVDSTTGLLSFSPPPKQDQTITFGSLPVKTIGDAPFQLSATASSLLPVSYTSSNTNVATVSSNTVTLVAAGTTTITASQAGNADFNAASPVSQVLVVNAASGYDSWAAGYGLSGANAATTADPDNDGFNNNSEYAFGTSPIAANGALLSTTNAGGQLTVSWIQRNTDLTYAVQSTANLADSFVDDGSVNVTISESQSGVPSGYTRRQFTVTATGVKFYRIKATP